MHLNHGVDKSYLLLMREGTTKASVRQIAEGDENKAAELLFFKAAQKVEISSQDRQKAEMVADFVVSQYGYTTERLA